MDISAINRATAPNLYDGGLPLNTTQANIEAAGILLYINNLVATYGSQFGAPGSDSRLMTILFALRSDLGNLVDHYKLSSKIGAGIFAFQSAWLGLICSVWDPSVSRWNIFQTLWTTGTFDPPDSPGGPYTMTPFHAEDIQTDIENQIQQNPSDLALPAGGGGTDAAYLFGLSMVENARDSANFFANGGASIYAAATVEFFQDAGIASEARALPITPGGGQDEGYFLEYLEKYETDGIPYTNQQIKTQAARLLLQYIKTLN